MISQINMLSACKLIATFLNYINENNQKNSSQQSFKPNEIKDYLKKYIYLTSDDSLKKYSMGFNRDYLIYMVTTVEENQVESVDKNRIESSVSIKSTQSKGKSLTLKALKSKIPIKANKKHNSLQDLSKIESDTKLNKGYEFIKKMIGMQSKMQAKCCHSNSTVEEIFMGAIDYEKPSQAKSVVNSKFPIHTSFISSSNNFLDYTLAEAMREMIELSNKLRESEIRIKDMIVKYIQDKELEQELVGYICGHGKILLESERRALNLASETWLQQAEIYKDQQKTLQATLNSIVTQNRDLQAENECLNKKNEKLSNKILLMEEGMPHKQTLITTNKVIDDMSRNNNKLRLKMSCATNRLSDLEQHLKKLQKRNDFLQQQINTSHMQLQNSRATYERTSGDHELEMAKILQELQRNSVVIKESVEAGEILLDDLDSLKSQMKTTTKTINWDKFKRRGKSLTDLIHLSRSCINELMRELAAKQNEINSHTKEKESLKEETEKQTQTAKELQQKIEDLQKQLTDNSNAVIDYRNLKKKFDDGQRTCSELEDLLDAKMGEIATQEDVIVQRNKTIDDLHNTIKEKESEYDELEAVVQKLEQDRKSLAIQVNGVAQVLTATGAGEIAKELAIIQGKFTELQEQYYTTIADKNYLITQMEAYGVEKQTLLLYQKDYHDKLQELERDFTNLEHLYQGVKDQLDVEKQTVLALQTERVRHLEERTILTAIYERLKGEISRVGQLEGAVSSMNQKASKLAMIAEYNKQLGQKLQHEVAERDETISTLQNNVKELNQFQLESTKEKAALCEELTQICGVKEILNTKLIAEVERNSLLGECRKEVENIASVQLRDMQLIYQKEHEALKTLLHEVKIIADERDKIFIENKELLKRIELMKDEKNEAINKLNVMQRTNSSQQIKIDELQSEVMKKFDVEGEIAELKSEIMYYKQDGEEMKAALEPLKSENENLRESVEYLQINIQKLRSEADQARDNEMNAKNVMAETSEAHTNLQKAINDKVQLFNMMEVEYNMVKENLYEMTEKYNELSKEYQKATDEASKFEKIVEEKFASQKEKSTPSTTTGSISEEIAIRDEEILILQEKLREYEEGDFRQLDEFEEFKTEKESLQSEIVNLVRDLENETLKTYEYEKRMLKLEDQLEEAKNESKTTAELEKQVELHKKNLEDLKSEFAFKTQNFQSDIITLTSKLNGSVSDYHQLAEAKTKMEKAHKEMALKLLKAAQVLVAEKVARQNTISDIKRLTEENANLKKEMATNESKTSQLRSDIDKMDAALRISQTDNLKYVSMLAEVDARRTLIEERMNSLNMQVALRTITDSHDEAESSARLEDAESRFHMLRVEMNHCHDEINKLQGELSRLESHCACIEFQKCESILRLHELQGKMETEKARHDEIQQAARSTLSLIVQIGETGSIPQNICNDLLNSIQTCVNLNKT